MMTKRDFEIIPPAREEFRLARQWYKQQHVQGLSNRFAQAVKDSIISIRTHPEAHAIRYRNVRIAHTETFPYAIHFYLDDDKIIITSIISRQKPFDRPRKGITKRVIPFAGWAMEQVILVDEQDKQIGMMEKMQAHREGRLHRAISVFIFNSKGEMLLQQRAAGKYHSPLLWTNACCSHPMPGELTANAARRRLREEMGMECVLNEIFSFVYKATFDNGLTEHEYDHVFKGTTDAAPQPQAAEAAGWKYITIDELKEDSVQHPEKYTAWFLICINKYLQQLTA